MAWGKSAAQGVDDWCKKLSANDPSLAHLTVLKHRKFDHSEVTKFSAALKGNTHLTELNASCHELTPETASVLGTALPLCQIASLSVGTSTFGDETLRALSTGLKDGAVKRLDLENKGLTQAGAEVCADILASSRNLTHLVLSRNQLGNAGAEALGKGPWSAPLEHLDLRSCGITADGLDAMLASPSTAAASSGSDATTAPFSLLKHMVLSGNQLGPTGGPAVAKLLTTATRMEELYLSNTDLGSGAVKELGNGLSQHPSIMILDLTSVGVDDDAGLALADGLSQNSSLKSLILSGNPSMSPAVIIRLAEAIKQRPQLASLDISGSKADSTCVPALGSVAHLEKLSLMGCELGSEGVVALCASLAAGQFAGLQDLCISGCEITLADFTSLFSALKAGGAPALQELECGANPGCQDDALPEMVAEMRTHRKTLNIHWIAADTQGAGGAPTPV